MSSKTGEGLSDLEAAISLLCEEMECLSASAQRPSASSAIGSARGFVIESKLDRHRGRVLQVIVRSGFLREGAWVAVGPHFGRIKRLFPSASGAAAVKTAGPNEAVEVSGLGDIEASAGQLLVQARSQQQAAKLAAMAQRASQVKLAAATLGLPGRN